MRGRSRTGVTVGNYKLSATVSFHNQMELFLPPTPNAAFITEHNTPLAVSFFQGWVLSVKGSIFAKKSD